MAIIGHIHKQGERCRNPFKGISATSSKAGDIYEVDGWELFYVPRHKMYIVCPTDRRGDFYEVFNFNCAAKILSERGKE